MQMRPQMQKEDKAAGAPAGRAPGVTRRVFVRASFAAAAGCLLGLGLGGCTAQDAAASPAAENVKILRAMPSRGRHAAVLLEKWSTAICHSSTTYSGEWLLSVTYALCNEGEGFLYSSGDVYIVAKQGKNKLDIRPQNPDGEAGSPPRVKVMPGEQKEMWQTWAITGTEPVVITFSDLMTHEVLACVTVNVTAGSEGML